MSKKSIIEREKKRKNLVAKYSTIRKRIKEQIDLSQSFEEKLIYHSRLQKLPKNSSPVRLHNRCLVTGRSKGYYRFFGLSRHVLRTMAHYGLLPGVTKSSW
uniref:ribosomal protein S14 n=1 Tax=Colacium mucronatum TaxID=167756 RepID=UPI0023AA7D6E|nr:ribosomal protein S14 [Colacium mucronatum]WCH63252.1 ribosomal protein S14 [Colacium mucronatum]